MGFEEKDHFCAAGERGGGLSDLRPFPNKGAFQRRSHTLEQARPTKCKRKKIIKKNMAENEEKNVLVQGSFFYLGPVLKSCK